MLLRLQYPFPPSYPPTNSKCYTVAVIPVYLDTVSVVMGAVRKKLSRGMKPRDGS